jgi:NAD(P)-dependent dehydrogenase (short-subunit alcohol dehydrogenase family)
MTSDPAELLSDNAHAGVLIVAAGQPLGSAVIQTLAEAGHHISLHTADDSAGAASLARALARQSPISKAAGGNIIILCPGVKAPIGTGHPMAALTYEAQAHDRLKQSRFHALTRSLALELAPMTRVNTISVQGSSIDARMIADTVLFILATQALTGQMITLDETTPIGATVQNRPS